MGLINECLVVACPFAPNEVSMFVFANCPYTAYNVRRILYSRGVNRRRGLQVLGTAICVTFDDGVRCVIGLMLAGGTINRFAVAGIAFRGGTAFIVGIINGHSGVSNVDRYVRRCRLSVAIFDRGVLRVVNASGSNDANCGVDFRVLCS